MGGVATKKYQQRDCKCGTGDLLKNGVESQHEYPMVRILEVIILCTHIIRKQLSGKLIATFAGLECLR